MLEQVDGCAVVDVCQVPIAVHELLYFVQEAEYALYAFGVVLLRHAYLNGFLQLDYLLLFLLH